VRGLYTLDGGAGGFTFAVEKLKGLESLFSQQSTTVKGKKQGPACRSARKIGWYSAAVRTDWLVWQLNGGLALLRGEEVAGGYH
jgi:hypothetical protein